MNSPSSVTIREARTSDLKRMVQLLADDKLGHIRESRDQELLPSYTQAFEEISLSKSNELLVAEIDNQVIGVLQITIIPNLTFKGGKRAQIEGVRVDTNFRSMGIGRLLIQAAIKRARKQSCILVQLTSNKSRQEAIQFYESLGFEASHEGLKLNIRHPG